MYYIYLFRNVSGLGYVGSTSDLKRRMRQHKWDNKNDYKRTCSSKQLFVEEVTMEVLEEVETKEKALIRERYYMRSLPNLVNKYNSFLTEEERLEYGRNYQKNKRTVNNETSKN